MTSIWKNLARILPIFPLPFQQVIHYPPVQSSHSIRVAIDPATGVPGHPATAINTITGWLDGSMVYGSDQATADSLRLPDGHMKTSAGNNLPIVDTAQGPAFAAGDVRAQENPDLTALQTLFVREHNYQVDLLHRDIRLAAAISFIKWLRQSPRQRLPILRTMNSYRTCWVQTLSQPIMATTLRSILRSPRSLKGQLIVSVTQSSRLTSRALTILELPPPLKHSLTSSLSLHRISWHRVGLTDCCVISRAIPPIRLILTSSKTYVVY